MISDSWLGIIITTLVCLVFGFSINKVEGAVAGLIAGAVVCLFGNMVSQTVFGITCTILLAVLIGSIVGWEAGSQSCAHRN